MTKLFPHFMKNINSWNQEVQLISNRKENHTKTSFLKASNKKKNHKGPEKRHITYKTQEIKNLLTSLRKQWKSENTGKRSAPKENYELKIIYPANNPK